MNRINEVFVSGMMISIEFIYVNLMSGLIGL